LKPLSILRRSSYFVLTMLCLFVTTATNTVHAQTSETMLYDEFWNQNTTQDFAGWTFNGTALASKHGQAQVKLAPAANLKCVSTDIDEGAASYDAAIGLCQGSDPYAAGTYNGQNYYNGGSFSFGTLVSPIHETAQPIYSLVASWNAQTPAGTWLQVHVRVLENNTWTHWYKLPMWASDFSAIQRHSIDDQWDTTGGIATDTFYTDVVPATAYQLSVTLFSTTASVSPTVSRMAVFASNEESTAPTIEPDQNTWGTNLAVPQRSQMLPEYSGLEYGGGGRVWCSPTSTSMIMAYWANVLHRPELNQTVPNAARDTYDFTYEGTGNWPYNTAYAGSYGLKAFVTRFYSMSQIEQWIKKGIPLVIGLAYEKDELPGTPIESSDGHLLVVRGFAANGDVITNDPAAASNEAVQITYNRAAIEKVWLKYSKGLVYVMMPQNWPVPTEKRLTNW
jgi:hypothetical protein